MNCSWQQVYSCLDPVVFSIGPFVFYWYALFFLFGWYASYRAALFFSEKGASISLSRAEIFDWWFWFLVAALIGARLGYALWYFPDLFFAHPWLFISPLDPVTGKWQGISGMSYHGGMIGVGFMLWWRAKKEDFWRIADLVTLAAPVALLCGRIGNFLNQELPGRITELSWGIFFPALQDSTLRHPVTLYEALGEGALLLIFLFWSRPFFRRPGSLALFFLFCYSSIRFFLEFLREPDAQVGFLWGGLTLGQILSFFTFMIVGAVWFWRQKYARIDHV